MCLLDCWRTVLVFYWWSAVYYKLLADQIFWSVIARHIMRICTNTYATT